jgi:hypothetical protein
MALPSFINLGRCSGGIPTPKLAPTAMVTADRFQQRGEGMKGAALAVVHLLRDIPTGEADNFAVVFRDITAKLTTEQQA